MKGRKPTPTTLKIVRGNPGKRSLEKEKFRPKSETPSPPPSLSSDALKVWEETVSELDRVGILTRIDTTTLEAFVNNLVMMRNMQSFIDKNGPTYESHTKNGVMYRKRPEASILNECQRKHLSFVSEFGLSPASRTRIPYDPNQGKLFGDWDGYK